MLRCWLRHFWRFMYRRSHGYKPITTARGGKFTKYAAVNGWISDHPRSAME